MSEEPARRGTCGAAALVLVLLVAAPASGAGAGPTNAGLDLVVLVDRSESVLTAGTAEAADLIVAYAIDFLLHSADSHRLRHRLAVVSFGSAARVDLPLAAVEPDRVAALRQAIAAGSRQSLGYTDFAAAFRAAADVLDGAFDAGRRRAVLLVSDGVPWNPAEETTDPLSPAAGWLAAASREHQPHLAVLLIADAGDADDETLSLWRDIASGRVRRTSRAPLQATAAVRSLLGDLLGVLSEPARPTADPRVHTLVLPPYLETVVFDIAGAGDGEVEILPPETPSVQMPPVRLQEVRLGRSLRVTTVHRPPPGRWRFRTTLPQAQVAISAREFFPRGVLLRPRDADTPRQFSSARIVYEIVDRNGRPLIEHPSYPLRVELAWTAFDIGEELHVLQRRPGAARTIFTTKVALLLDRSGRYWTPMTVTVEDVDRQRTTVFHDRWSGFSVAEAERIECSMLSPRMNERLPIHRFTPFYSPPQALYVRCTRQDGSPLTTASDAGTLLQAIALRPHGSPPLSITFESIERGIFRGWLPNPARPGHYHIKLRFRDDDRRYVARFDPDEIIFVRQRPPQARNETLLVLLFVGTVIVAILVRWRRRRSARLAKGPS
jgi:hypothetical protein